MITQDGAGVADIWHVVQRDCARTTTDLTQCLPLVFCGLRGAGCAGSDNFALPGTGSAAGEPESMGDFDGQGEADRANWGHFFDY